MPNLESARAPLVSRFFATLALAAGLLGSASQAALITAGTPTTSVPAHLTDGSYPFGITVTLVPGQFLLPVEISGAANLQNWQFDVLFDNTVVEVYDPFDGTSGIYGAEFTPGDPLTLSFILGGFPLNSMGLVDDVAGSYPSLLAGPWGDGILAYILFQYIPGQENEDPGFDVVNPTVLQVPEPGSLAPFAGVLLVCSVFARRWGHPK
ncbi:MAG: hypothetical protein ACKVQA_17405 [Burkholderiales bacterium]